MWLNVLLHAYKWYSNTTFLLLKNMRLALKNILSAILDKIGKSTSKEENLKTVKPINKKTLYEAFWYQWIKWHKKVPVLI